MPTALRFACTSGSATTAPTALGTAFLTKVPPRVAARPPGIIRFSTAGKVPNTLAVPLLAPANSLPSAPSAVS
ncbi:hypothetical protein D3C86_2006280 [compost metagenome]